MGEGKVIRRSLPVLPTVPSPVVAGAATVGRGGGGAPVRVGLVTLGCDKNTVDSERILGRLVGAGAEVSGEVEGADVVVVNTCGFIDLAKEESVDAILEAVRLKEAGRTRAVVAMGCLVQRYKAELEAEIPEVDLFLGLTEADQLIPRLRARGLLPDPDSLVPTMERPLRILTTATPHTSYLKISEGCDHGCAFCAIPLMRGKHRSTPIEVLVREAQELEARGVVELNLISQDTTWYGRDLVRAAATGLATRGEDSAEYFVGKPFAGMAGGDPLAAAAGLGGGGLAGAAGFAGAAGLAGAADGAVGVGADLALGGPERRRGLLPDLLRALLDETGIPWFRLFYMYPSGIQPELVELIAREERILPYLDMPIQHGSDAVLKRMRRPERRATILERVRRLRDAVPGLTLRTTVIVGFPGETDEEFEELLDLLEEVRFDRFGAFAYSVEEGTPAATMANQVPDEVKRERLERLSDVQRAISLENHEARVGRIETVLIDHAADAEGDAYGRTAGQAIDVDGVTHVQGAEGVRPGEFIRVRIVEADEDDLFAEMVGDE
jgi:tRNA A37 methylthiotransferase MiaB